MSDQTRLRKALAKGALNAALLDGREHDAGYWDEAVDALHALVAERDAAVHLLRAVVKAADDDARMGYPLPGESCVYVVLALRVDEFLASLSAAATEPGGEA